jgi:hypothetical protein
VHHPLSIKVLKLLVEKEISGIAVFTRQQIDDSEALRSQGSGGLLEGQTLTPRRTNGTGPPP